MLFHVTTGIQCTCASIALTSVLTSIATAQPAVKLAWNASGGSMIAGYRLYVGVTSQTYTTLVDVGNATTATVSNLAPMRTYYFAVTAYDVAGVESLFSSEISYTVGPGPATPVRLSLAVPTSKVVLLTGNAPTAYAFEVLVSSDLSRWTTIGTVVSDTAGLLHFAEPILPANRARYYRLRQTSP